MPGEDTNFTTSCDVVMFVGTPVAKLSAVPFRLQLAKQHQAPQGTTPARASVQPAADVNQGITQGPKAQRQSGKRRKIAATAATAVESDEAAHVADDTEGGPPAQGRSPGQSQDAPQASAGTQRRAEELQQVNPPAHCRFGTDYSTICHRGRGGGA